MKHTILPLVVCALMAVCTGCRREDVRTFTVTLPGLTEANKAQIAEALSKYNGIKKDSYVWDMSAKTLTMRYDSMQIAKENIRQAIEEKKIAVSR